MGIQPTNAGIDFQQRVSAWFLINMLFELKLDNTLNIGIDHLISEISFETQGEIDDLVIKTENHKKIYMQMKRSISLSTENTSEFYSVCNQFVGQFVQNNNNDIAYILVTSHNASSNITETMRRILDSIRTSQKFSVVQEFNKKEMESFVKIEGILKNIYLNLSGKDMSEDDLLKLLSKIYVEIFDIENGQSYEKTVKMLLYNKISVNVDLFWSNMIKIALNLASNRQVITREYINRTFQKYLKDIDMKEATDIEKKLLNISFESDTLEIKMDYVLALSNDKIDSLFNINEKVGCQKKMYLIELYRFDSKGNRKVEYFAPNKLILGNGIELNIIYRSATQKGIERFVASEEYTQQYQGYNLIYIAANKNNEESNLEQIQANYLKKCLENKKNLKCINCGKAIFQEETYICELDDDSISNDAGMVHKECLIPVNRVLGVSKIPTEEDYSYLKRFDVNLWIKQIKDGQFFAGGLNNLYQNINPMVVDTDDIFDLGDYSVRTILEDGTFKFTTSRGNIDRFRKDEAEKFVEDLNHRIQEAKKDGNPICYSSESFTFGYYDKLVQLLGGKEEYLECKKSEVVRYSEAVAKLYNKCRNFYAPLIYLSIDEKPLVIGDVFPLFSNPLEIKVYLNNWEHAGINVKNYQINIINDDNEFRLKIISLINQKLRPIANMKIGKNGELISGIIFYTMHEVENSNI